mmetsp:Transcript_25769/g.29674  ORF Transcript_25769/g.29674 Transcript_25769/m.29674 type:complete len:110 (-) Transcript_25769:58-387(-)
MVKNSSFVKSEVYEEIIRKKTTKFVKEQNFDKESVVKRSQFNNETAKKEASKSSHIVSRELANISKDLEKSVHSMGNFVMPPEESKNLDASININHDFLENDMLFEKGG